MLIDGTKCGERGLCRQGVCVEGGVVSNRSLSYSVLLFLPLTLVSLACIFLYKKL
jgi:hypothetical protein